MSAESSKMENNLSSESELTSKIENNLESDDINIQKNKSINSDTNNKPDKSDKSDTNYNSDKVDSIPQYETDKTSYDINLNLNSEDISKINEIGGQKSQDLTLTTVSKMSAIDSEMENHINLQILEGQESPEVFKTYKTRFWVLIVYCYASFMMLLIWGTFSPILVSAEYAYGWSDGYIALLEGWGSIFSLITMIPFGYAVNKYGLRMGMILICVLLSLSTGVRCVTTDVTAFKYLASLSAIINGMCSCVVLSLPALISVVWFPVQERATATAISATSMQLGITGMYMAPLIVRTPENNEPPKEDIRSDIQLLMFIYFGMALLSLVCTLIYYPAAPPTPPSASSSEERVNFLKSMKAMLKKYDVMTIVLIYTFSTSIPVCWLSVINLSMDCLGISQDESMWIAIAASLISIFLTIVVGRLTDYFRGYMKVSIAGLLLGSSGCFLWFLLITEQVIMVSKTQVYISVIFGIGLQYSAVPLMIELAVELAYPSPENAVGTLFSGMLELCDVTFLLLMMIETDCYIWLSYALVLSTCLTVIPLIFVKEVYHRSAVDQKNEERGMPTVANGVLPVANGVPIVSNP